MKRQVLCGASLAVAVTFWGQGMAGAAELVAANAAQAEVQGDVPVTEVDVTDKKTSGQIAKPDSSGEGSAENGYRVNTAQVGPLGTIALQDTPYSIQVVSSDLMNNLQAKSVSDALKYNPTVNDSYGGNSLSPQFLIRGFQAGSSGSTTSMTIDGMRTYSRTDPVEDKERVEVLNGASSFLYGIGSPAGIVNYVLKRPTSIPLADVTIGNYGGAQSYIHGDFGGPLDSEGRLSYRANLLYVNDGSDGIQDQTHGRHLVSLALDWHTDSKSLFSFDYSHYYRDIEHGDDLFSVGSGVTSIPKAPDADKNYMPSYSVAKDWFDRYGVQYTRKIDDDTTFRSALRYSDVRSYRHRANTTITNNDGDFTMGRNYYDMEMLTTQGNAYLDHTFKTGTVSHKVTLGYSEDDTNFKYAYPYSNGSVKYSGTNNIYDTVDWPADKAGDTSGSPDRTTEKLRLRSIIVGDQITFNPRWSMLTGVNRTSIDDRTWNYKNYVSTGKVTENPENNKTEWTPAVSLMYKPTPGITTYVSYMESLQPGPTAPDTTANSGDVLAPYSSKQTELGIKTKLGSMDVTTALFRIEKANAYTDPVTNIYSEDGREKHTGVEFTATGKVSQNVTLIGGFTLLDAEVTKTSTTNLLGKTPSGVPERMARLYAEYTVPSVPGLVLTGGISYTGKQWVNDTNTLSIPHVVTGDLGARYPVKMDGKEVMLRLNVYNITNKNYWTTTGGNSVALGYPRTIAFSAETKL